MTPGPAVLEVAPTGRAKCRACGQAIAKGTVRLGERVPNPFADGEDAETTHWYHPVCASFKRPEPLLDALQGADVEVADRGRLETEATVGVAHRRAVRVDAASRAPSGRAMCRACKEPIAKDTWRIGLVFYEDGRFAPSGFIHAACAPAYLETSALMPRLRHFSPALSDADLVDVDVAIGTTR
ncbi:MAG: hypothetical protein IT183_10845 [Acidobacteria bacterium]|nr:hypothetical protein [Acidobacteriota bacterium]